MKKVRVCIIDLFKDGQLMNSEVKRVYKTTSSALEYINTEVSRYMDAYNGEAFIKEQHNGFVEISIRGWIRRYYYVLKTLDD